MSKGLLNKRCSRTFFIFVGTSLSQTVQRLPIKVYIRGSIIGTTTPKYGTETSLTHPLILHGSKSAIFGLIAQQCSTLSRCGLETEQDILFLNLLCIDEVAVSVLAKFSADRSTRFSKHPFRFSAPLKRTKICSRYQ